MKNKKIFYSFLVFSISIFFFCYYRARLPEANKFLTTTAQEDLNKSANEKKPKGAYFVPVFLSKITDRGLPCLPVQIGDMKFDMELDLGFRGDLSIQSSYMDSIASKTWIDTDFIYGFRGKSYPINLYKIPSIQIGAMSFIQPILQEVNEEWRNDAIIAQDKTDIPLHQPGRIGWELFYNVNLLLDLPSSKIAFCDNIATLSNQGYQIENFIKIPLLIERGLVELEMETTSETLVCLLDTGTTWNILNTETQPNQSMEQDIWNPTNQVTYPLCKIGNINFGPIKFRKIPIRLPIQIQAILGMEFFKHHVVFIDFSEKFIYLEKRLCDKIN